MPGAWRWVRRRGSSASSLLRKGSRQGIGGGSGNLQGYFVSDQVFGADGMSRLQSGRAAGDLARVPPGSGEQARQGPPHALRIEACLLFTQQRLQFGEPPLLLRLDDLPRRSGGGRAG